MLCSRTAFDRRSPGFSLLEVMVVLILIALASGLAVTRIGAGQDAAENRNAMQDIVSALASARRGAIRSGQPRSVQLSQDGRLTLLTIETPNPRAEQSAGTILVTFLPDGSSTGGRIALLSPMSATLTIDRFVGGVTIEPGNE
ncbi:MAG: prepilin-type N-terminal cleavage/methylation domain-containing protein [Pseudomonadota bacterium]